METEDTPLAGGPVEELERPEASSDTKEERDLLNAILPEDDPTRKRAERTASPMDFESLLLKGFVEQTFEITPKLRVTMRSLSAGHLEYIGTRLAEKYEESWSMVFQEAARVYYLAASLQKIGDVPVGPELPSSCSDREAVDPAFDARVEKIKALSGNLVYLLYNHYLLFNNRVDTFIKGGSEELGNF